MVRGSLISLTQNNLFKTFSKPKPNFNHKFQMDKVDQQANILKKRLVVAGKKVRERILRDMRGTSSLKFNIFYRVQLFKFIFNGLKF